MIFHFFEKKSKNQKKLKKFEFSNFWKILEKFPGTFPEPEPTKNMRIEKIRKNRYFQI